MTGEAWKEALRKDRAKPFSQRKWGNMALPGISKLWQLSEGVPDCPAPAVAK